MSRSEIKSGGEDEKRGMKGKERKEDLRVVSELVMTAAGGIVVLLKAVFH